MNIKSFPLLVALATTCTLSSSAEVSVFGAGNLESSKPYGLTKSEEHIFKNKKNIDSLDTDVKSISATVDQLAQRLDGLESIYDGDSQKLNRLNVRFFESLRKIEANSNKSTQLTNETKEIKSNISNLIILQDKYNKELNTKISTLKDITKKLSKVVEKIDKEYITLSDLKKNSEQFVVRNEFEDFKKKLFKELENLVSSPQKSSSNSTTSFEGKNSTELLIEAKAHFKKYHFKKAIPIFEHLVAKKYKPAMSNYYLGKMWFVRKDYKKAISYFKESATLYDKAEYMPTLLYNTAQSFENLNDFDNSATFYNILIQKYPNSQEAKKYNQSSE
jgi:TolA-binding protein